jgi:biopolymer transport protein TolR
MAFGRLERPRGVHAMSDINMTPLIDVMLVLLVIFMITAPLMSSGLRLALPSSNAVALNDAPKFLDVAVTPEGKLYLGEEPLSAGAFSARVEAAARQTPDIEVHLRADKRTPYGVVATLIGLLQKAGLNRIALVTEPATVVNAPPAQLEPEKSP